MLTAVAILGWIVASLAIAGGWYYRRALRRHQCPLEPPTRAILVSASGLPESMRTFRNGIAPEMYTRPRGKAAAIEYRRVGTAVLYQTTER